MLLATPRGRKLRGDPGGLWWHLAEQVPPPKSACHETHSGILLLAAVAAGPQAVPDPFGYVTQMLYEAGWASSDGTPADRWQARDAATDTYIPLIRLGALIPDRPGSAPDQPTANGALFARAALRI